MSVRSVTRSDTAHAVPDELAKLCWDLLQKGQEVRRKGNCPSPLAPYPLPLTPDFYPAFCGVVRFAPRPLVWPPLDALRASAASPSSFLPRRRSAAARNRPPTPAFGFAAAAAFVCFGSAFGSYSLPTSSSCASSALSPRR